MKRLNLIALVVLSTVVISCKKDKNDDPNPVIPTTVKNCLIQMDSAGDGTIVKYFYDNQDRITQAKSYLNSDSSISVYTYTNNVVVVASEFMEQTFYLNKKGFADSATYFIDGLVDIKIRLTYDSSWQVVKQMAEGEFQSKEVYEVNTYEYLNGNMIKETSDDGSGISTITFEYFLDKPNLSKKFDESTQFYNGNKNLMKKVNNPDGSSVTYEYVLDTDGKVSKKTTHNQDGTNTVENFSWACK